MEEKLNLYQKIQLVSNEIKNIEKNMTVGKGNYAYKAVQDIDVTLEVKEAETKHGLVSIPIKQELIKSEVIRVVKEGGGESINYMDIVKMTLRIINLDNTSECIDVESFGRGLDPGDKGFGKASTYARKYALLNAYKIATGEDPDENKSKVQTPVTVDEVKNSVIGYMMNDNQYTQNILSYFNVGSPEDMTNEQFKMAYNNLKKERENMTETMYIGSGDIHALMSGKNTKSHIALMQRFVSGIKPYYNAYASPIDALRTGAILENRYLFTLPDNYFTQYVVRSDEMNVFKCSLDFACIEKGRLTDFDELKTLYLSDYLEFIEPIKNDNNALIEYVRKKHKAYYYQVQEQLFCTQLESCNLVFLSVTTYDDESNWHRDILPNEYCKVRITRDEKTINEIKKRGLIFQQIKDFYSN